jgi:hypothetical protein
MDIRNHSNNERKLDFHIMISFFTFNVNIKSYNKLVTKATPNVQWPAIKTFLLRQNPNV